MSNHSDALNISDLPRIAATISSNNSVEFLILDYREFVEIAGRCEGDIPDVELISRDNKREFVSVSVRGFCDLLSQFNICGEVDANHYLAEHHDVKKAIINGRVTDAKSHYIFSGYIERRTVKFLDLGQMS